MTKKYLCVFCGANPGLDPDFQKMAKDLALKMHDKGYGLVYGGASVGIMGLLADTILEKKGDVIGVIPQTLVDLEVAHANLTSLHIVKTMHERKQKMYDLSDAFVIFPGGFGTLDEMFEIITWCQIGLHCKKVILCNVKGYFNSLIQFIDGAAAAGFIKPHHRKILNVVSTPEEIFELL